MIWVCDFLVFEVVRIESVKFFFLLVGFNFLCVEIILEFDWIIKVLLGFLMEYEIVFLFLLVVWICVIKVFVGVFLGILA